MSGNSTKPILLDGGMGQEIVNRGGKSAYGEWAVAALHENPQIVTDIHRDYIRAGADVITTNTYSTTRTRLQHVDMEDRFEELVRLAGELATSACQAENAPHVKIAASLGPLEASYINEFQLSYDEMIVQFGELMELLDPYVDIYLGETFSTVQESNAFLTAAQERDKTTWVSWTLQDRNDNQLRGGESLQQAIQSLESYSPDAVLINCCTPERISQSLDTLGSAGIQFGGYANGFVEVTDDWLSVGDVDQLHARTDLSPEIYAGYVANWIESGVSIVGGCCETGPAHIAQLRQTIDHIRSM